MKSKIILVILNVFVISFSLYSQNILGLWEVKSVTVGDQSMTPIGRWTQFNDDSTYYSGNGWQQHSCGTFGMIESQLKLQEKNGIIDPFGAFEVLKLNSDTMIWKRVEEGDEIEVILVKAYKKPESLSNKIIGLWQIKSNSISNNSYLHFRWDRVLIDCYDGLSKKIGYWQINGHKPILTLIFEEETFVKWEIYSLTDSMLKLRGISKSNLDKFISYNRINQFPE